MLNIWIEMRLHSIISHSFAWYAKKHSQTKPWSNWVNISRSYIPVKPTKMWAISRTCATNVARTKLYMTCLPLLHKNDDSLCASHNIALLIAKAGKAHTIEEALIATVIREVMTTVLKRNPEPVLKAISLNSNTVQRRIDEMTGDTEKNLQHFAKHGV